MEQLHKGLEGQLRRPRKSHRRNHAASENSTGKNFIDKLNTKFRLLIQKTGLDILTNAALLIQMYERAINPHLFHTIVVRRKNSTSLETYMKNASEVDCAYRQTTSVMSNTFKRNTKKGGQKQQSFWPSSQGNGDTPMDVNVLSKLECYNCGKKGHFAQDCRSPKKNQQKREQKRKVETTRVQNSDHSSSKLRFCAMI